MHTRRSNVGGVAGNDMPAKDRLRIGKRLTLMEIALYNSIVCRSVINMVRCKGKAIAIWK